jgi:hypothetical protein
LNWIERFSTSRSGDFIAGGFLRRGEGHRRRCKRQEMP